MRQIFVVVSNYLTTFFNTLAIVFIRDKFFFCLKSGKTEILIVTKRTLKGSRENAKMFPLSCWHITREEAIFVFLFPLHYDGTVVRRYFKKIRPIFK